MQRPGQAGGPGDGGGPVVSIRDLSLMADFGDELLRVGSRDVVQLSDLPRNTPGFVLSRYASAVSNPLSSQGRRRSRVVFWALVGLCAVALIGGAATVIATERSFTESSTSMENTIRPGDLMVMDRTTQVHRGDVIVEQQPSTGPGYFIRRVIGLPGDHVACCNARGRMTVNGKPLDETYLYPADAPS